MSVQGPHQFCNAAPIAVRAVGLCGCIGRVCKQLNICTAAVVQEPLTAVFLHGLLGSSRNWRSFSRKLAQDAAARINR